MNTESLEELVRTNAAILVQVEMLLNEFKPRSPIMLRSEAKELTTRLSDDSFDSWCAHWGVRPVSRGRYSRDAIELALKRESGEAHTPMTLRRKQSV